MIIAGNAKGNYMINPTSAWMSKHGYSMWSVEREPGYYVHTLENTGIFCPKKHVIVRLDRRVYDQLQTDSARRAMLYKAILKAEGE